MKNQQLEFDLSNTSLVLELTGNPWTDFGIVSLCQELSSPKPDFLVEKPFLTENMATITIDISDIEEVKTWFYQTLRDKWNSIYHRSFIAKLLEYTPNQESGFINPDETINITDEYREIIKKELIKRKIKRNIKIEDRVSVFERRYNFIGLPANIKIIRKNMESIIDESIESLKNPSSGKLCSISGLSFKKGKDVTQYVNPFSNKYHNYPIRGAASSASYTKVSSIHYMVNLLTTLCPNIPFVRDAEIMLILPVIPDLHLLSEIYNRLLGSNNLKDLNGTDETISSTNLRDIRAPYDDYSLSIYLFHNIFYRFSKKEKRMLFNPIDNPEQNVPLLRRWVKIPFTRPNPSRNQRELRFGNFHHIEVDHRLYKFICPIPFNDNFKIQLVPDILARIKPALIKGKRDIRGENSLRQLSKAIATSDTKLMKVAIFNLWKHADGINISFDKQTETPHPLQMFRHFIQYFLEVNAVLDDKELRGDLRTLGNTIGKVFSRDVTLISKLYNVSSEGAFRAVLKQITFRLFKTGLIDGKVEDDGKFRVKVVKVKNEKKSLIHISSEKVTHILDGLTQENWQSIAETLSTFTSLSAFNENLSKDLSKRQTKGEKND